MRVSPGSRSTRPLPATLLPRPQPATVVHENDDATADRNGTASAAADGPVRAAISPYYPADDLDDPPGIVDEPDFADSEISSYSGGGQVLLKLLIDETGGIDKAMILARTVPEDIAEAGRRKFLSARANPGRLNGNPVKSALLIEISYAPITPPSLPRQVLNLSSESGEIPGTRR